MVGLMPVLLGNSDYDWTQEFNAIWYVVFLMYFFIIAIVIPNIMNAIAVKEVSGITRQFGLLKVKWEMKFLAVTFECEISGSIAIAFKLKQA